MALFDALRHRDFRLVLAGQAVSLLGDSIFFVALAWQGLLTTGSDPARVGLVSAAFFVGQVGFVLLGGVLVDRLPRRLVVACSDVAQLALCATLAALVAGGALTFPGLLAIAFVFGAAAALAMPAMSAFLPETVPAEDYASANSLFQGARTLATVLGAAFGGLLIAAVGTAAAFGVNAASFAVSAACVLLTRGRPIARARRGSLLADAWAGGRYVARFAWIWIAILVFALFNFVEVGPRNVGTPFLLTTQLGVGAEALGLVNAAAGAGGLLAVLLLGAWAPRAHRGAIAYASSLAVGFVFVGFGIATNVAAVAALSFARGACFATFGVLYETALGEQVAPEMRGRVSSLDLLGSYALLPFSPALTGLIIAQVGVRATFIAAGVLLAVGCAAAMAVPAARRFENPS